VYRTIETAFWTDPRIVALKPDGKLLCLYLVTNPHAHVSGIYYLPDTIVSHETGLSASRVDTLWDTLSSAGFSRRDKKREVIWVLRMFFYQGRGSKNERAAAKHIQTLHKSSLVNDFLAAYPAVQRWFSDRVSIGYPKLDESGTQEQEQEQEQDISLAGQKTFHAPTIEEVGSYCRDRNNGIDPSQFVDYYQARNWMLNKVKMKDWQAAVRTWERNHKERASANASQQPLCFPDAK